MLTKNNFARVFTMYQEKCPKCGGDLVKVPYFSGVLTPLGTRREAASLATDRLVTSYSVDFLEQEFGAFCPACTEKNVRDQNAYIEKENARKAEEYGRLSEKQRKARHCPAGTVVFLVCMALALVVLGLLLFGVTVLSTAGPIIACLVLLGGALGFATWVSNEDGLFPRRYPESEYKQVPLYEVPEFTMEELADMIVKDRGYGDVRKYFTPETIRRMRG